MIVGSQVIAMVVVIKKNIYILYKMFCQQMKIYIVYIIVQSLISLAISGVAKLEIFGPLVFLGMLYLLCKYKQFTVANVLVALTIVLGIAVDVYALSNRTAVKHVLVAQAGHRDDVKA